MSETLTPAELVAVTGKRRIAAQAGALARMGVPYAFTGTAIDLLRAVGEAHALVKPPEPEEEEFPIAPPSDYMRGLRRWREERAWAAERHAEAMREDEEMRVAMAPEREARERIERMAKRRARGAARRASVRVQTPAWADKERISEVYALAVKLTEQSGLPHHVDHEIPLRGRRVSGLHVHDNLRVITATENLRKRNKFEPC